MMWSLKKALLVILPLLIGWSVTHAVAPSFYDNFGKYLTQSTSSSSEYGAETVFNICIDRNISLMANIRNLFYPSSIASGGCWGQWGQLWMVIRDLCFVLLFVFLVMVWVNFIMNAKEADGAKKAFSSLIYILYWAFLIFWVTWILWTVLDIGNVQWSAQLVERIQNTLFLQILSFFKVLAFFAAIIMLAVSGFKMMSAMDKADKVKIAQKWAINVIIALIFIKIIDYIFYIAQSPDFWTKAADLIVNVAIVLGWILGWLFVLALFYSWYLMITSSGKEEAWKKAKWIIINIFVIALVIFIFLLIVYQIFNEFG